MSNAAKKWQVQVRKSAKHKWRVYGTYETRAVARDKCNELRNCWSCGPASMSGFGFGNTRVVRKITGGL